jgi:hypothetical protein
VISFNANPEWESSAEKKKHMLTLIGKQKHIKIHHSCITLSLLNRPHHIQGEEDGRRGTNPGAGEASQNRTRGNGYMGRRRRSEIAFLSNPFPKNKITIAFGIIISETQPKYKYFCNFLILGCRGPGIEEMDPVRFGFLISRIAFRIIYIRTLFAIIIVPTMHSILFIFEWAPLYHIRSRH